MAKKKPKSFEDPTRFILESMEEVAAFAGVSRQVVQKLWVDEQGMPRHLISEPTAGISAYAYDASEIFKWYITEGPGSAYKRRTGKEFSRNPQQQPLPTEEDALLSGPPTPALERLRTAKAKMAELDLEERSKSSVPIADLLPILTAVAGPLRKAGEKLGKLHGPAAQRLHNDAIAEYIGGIERQFRLLQEQATANRDSISSNPDVANGDDPSSPPDGSMGGGRDHHSEREETGAIPPCNAPGEQDPVCGVRQAVLVENGDHSPDAERQDRDGVCDSGSVPSV